MGITFDTIDSRPNVGIHQVYYSAVVANRDVPPRRYVVAASAGFPSKRRSACYEASWMLDDEGRLSCSWHAVAV